MKTLILLGMMVVGAGAQTAKPVAKPEKPPAAEGTLCDDKHPCLTYSSTAEVLRATWSHAVKDGVYTATFTDPDNHWRCYVTGRMPEGLPTAFTVTCVDTTKTYTEPPSVPKGAKP